MPYSGASDPKLPSNVKKLSAKKRRQWIHVYESARGRGADEGSAFAQANSVAGRRKDLNVTDRLKSILRLSSPTKSLVLVKDANGRLRFFGSPTNVFRDRQHEIITTKAHEEYVEWVYKSGLFPRLWLWHTKGSDIGQTDWVEFADGLVSISGLIDVDKEEIAQKAIEQADPGMSHMFVAKYNDHGDIVRYRTFEFSVLPREFCANEWTDFSVWKEGDMAFSQEKRKYLLGTGISEDVVSKWETENKALGEKLKGMGVDWKDDESEDEEDGVELLAGLLAAQTTAINALVDRVNGLAGLEERVASVEKSIDEKVADAMTGAIGKLPKGHEASKSDDNLVKKDDAKSEGDLTWFFGELTGQPVK